MVTPWMISMRLTKRSTTGRAALADEGKKTGLGGVRISGRAN